MKNFIYRLAITMLLTIIITSSFQCALNLYRWSKDESLIHSGDGYRCITIYTPSEVVSCFVYE